MPRRRIYASNAARQKAYRKRLKRRYGWKFAFSSKNDKWITPQSLFDSLDREFHFTLDVCATAENAKCATFYSPAADGMTREWTGVCWMNPPYGRAIGLWIAKAVREAQAGATVVALLPARTGSAWWQDYVMKATEIRYLRGRTRFEGAKHNAPFDSAVAVFKPNEKLAELGRIENELARRNPNNEIKNL